MTLHGWRQLIEWSIEHSCMDPHERAEVYTAWLSMWEKFCLDIIRDHELDLIEGKYLEPPADDEDEVMLDAAEPTGRRGQSSSTTAL